MNLTVSVRPSAWQFVTFGSGGVGVGFFAASGGTIVLKSPAGNDISFYYGGAGAGLSAGLKIPRLGRVQIPTRGGPGTGSVGPTAVPSTGTIMVTGNVAGELTESDIQGCCAFVEAGGGLIVGGSGVALLAGCNPAWLAVPVIGPERFTNSARALIMMAGLNVGVQAQVGITASIGYLH